MSEVAEELNWLLRFALKDLHQKIEKELTRLVFDEGVPIDVLAIHYEEPEFKDGKFQLRASISQRGLILCNIDRI